MRRALDAGTLEILPCRSAPRRARFPQVTDEQCLTAMQLVLPDGRVLAGADAMPELLRRIRAGADRRAVRAARHAPARARRLCLDRAQPHARVVCTPEMIRALPREVAGRAAMRMNPAPTARPRREQ